MRLLNHTLYQASDNQLSYFYPVTDGQHCDTFIRDAENFLPQVTNFINRIRTQG